MDYEYLETPVFPLNAGDRVWKETIWMPAFKSLKRALVHADQTLPGLSKGKTST